MACQQEREAHRRKKKRNDEASLLDWAKRACLRDKDRATQGQEAVEAEQGATQEQEVVEAVEAEQGAMVAVADSVCHSNLSAMIAAAKDRQANVESHRRVTELREFGLQQWSVEETRRLQSLPEPQLHQMEGGCMLPHTCMHEGRQLGLPVSYAYVVPPVSTFVEHVVGSTKYTSAEGESLRKQMREFWSQRHRGLRLCDLAKLPTRKTTTSVCFIAGFCLHTPAGKHILECHRTFTDLLKPLIAPRQPIRSLYDDARVVVHLRPGSREPQLPEVLSDCDMWAHVGFGNLNNFAFSMLPLECVEAVPVTSGVVVKLLHCGDNGSAAPLNSHKMFRNFVEKCMHEKQITMEIYMLVDSDVRIDDFLPKFVWARSLRDRVVLPFEKKKKLKTLPVKSGAGSGRAKRALQDKGQQALCDVEECFEDPLVLLHDADAVDTCPLDDLFDEACYVRLVVIVIPRRADAPIPATVHA